MAFRDIYPKLRDLTMLDWTERGFSSGTGGMLLKAREQTGGTLWYYKASSYDGYRGVYGHECVNELVASRLMDALGVAHLRYDLIHAQIEVDGSTHQTWVSRSKSFRRKGERKLGLDTFFDLYRMEGESPLGLCERFGWSDQVQQMMAVDYLIANRDRHGANIEVLVARDGSFRLAPIFDCGLSLVFSCFGDEEQVRAFDPMRDVVANNYLGTRSLEENLAFVRPESIGGWSLDQDDLDDITRGIDLALPPAHVKKIREIIWERWVHLEALRDH